MYFFPLHISCSNAVLGMWEELRSLMLLHMCRVEMKIAGIEYPNPDSSSAVPRYIGTSQYITNCILKSLMFIPIIRSYYQ